jgi:hypothetical protein
MLYQRINPSVSKKSDFEIIQFGHYMRNMGEKKPQLAGSAV